MRFGNLIGDRGVDGVLGTSALQVQHLNGQTVEASCAQAQRCMNFLLPVVRFSAILTRRRDHEASWLERTMANTRRKRDLTHQAGHLRRDTVHEAGHPEMVRVRMTVDLGGPLASELERTAQELGKTKTEVVREGLSYVFRALKARNDGFLVGAWKEEADGRITRSREFAVGN